MSGISLKSCLDEFLVEVYPNLQNAYIFVDDVFNDFFHCNIPPNVILSMNPAAIVNLPGPTSDDTIPQFNIINTPDTLGIPRKAVFFIGTFLHVYERVVGDILKKFTFDECLVYCAISNLGHARCSGAIQKRFGSTGAYEWFKEVVVKPALEEGSPIEVTHFEPTISLFSSMSFTVPLPDGCTCMCLEDHPLKDVGTLAMLAERLQSMFTSLNAKYDIWAIGPAAKRLGKIITPSEITGDNVPKVSLILVDRALDIIPCVAHGPSTLERILDVLPQYGSCDVHVNTGPLFGEGIGTDDTFGTIVHPEAENGQNYVDLALAKSITQFTSILLQKLKESAPAHPQNVRSQTSLSSKEVQEILAYLSICAKNWPWPSENAVLFDWAAAVAEVSQSCSTPDALYDKLMAIEKDIPVFATIGFYMFIYSLVGPSIVDKIDTTAAIEFLTKEITNSVELKLRKIADPAAATTTTTTDDDNDFLTIAELPDGITTIPIKIQSAARAKLERVFERIRAIGTARTTLRDFASVTSTVAGSTVGMYSSLLDQLMTRVFTPTQPMPADLMHMGEKAGGLLLWSRFASSAQPARPTDSKTVMVFFVGGVSVKELNSLRLFAEKHKTHQFIVGSTKLLTSTSFVNEIIF